MSYILLLIGGSDYYGPLVKDCLANSKYEILEIDYEDPRPFSFEIASDGEVGFRFAGGWRGLPLAAWYRWKAHAPFKITDDHQVAERLAHTEWSAFRGGLAAVLQGRLLNNSPTAYLKIYQQRLAASVGFSIPDSSFSVGKSTAVATVRRFSSSVMKAIGSPNLARFDHPETDSDFLSTTPVSEGFLLAQDASRFCQCPLWFQRQVESGVELRIIVFGEEVFGTLILGQLAERRHVDSRLNKRVFQRVDLDAKLKKLVLLFMKEAGLDFGVLDLIESEGRYWFLECNPDGQWESALSYSLEQAGEAAARLIESRADHYSASDTVRL